MLNEIINTMEEYYKFYEWLEQWLAEDLEDIKDDDYVRHDRRHDTGDFMHGLFIIDTPPDLLSR